MYLGELYDAAYGFLDHLDRSVPGGLQPIERHLEEKEDTDGEEQNEADGSISINIDMDKSFMGSGDDEEGPASAAGQGS